MLEGGEICGRQVTVVPELMLGSIPEETRALVLALSPEVGKLHAHLQYGG